MSKKKPTDTGIIEKNRKRMDTILTELQALHAKHCGCGDMAHELGGLTVLLQIAIGDHLKRSGLSAEDIAVIMSEATRQAGALDVLRTKLH